jgi:hypothetical protein
MVRQATIQFDAQRGEELARAGMELAVETANAEHPKWSERCWKLFWQWLNKKPRYHEFMIEDFRQDLYKYDLIEKPKSDRAYGFLSKRAVKQGLIMHAGTAKVKNSNAHGTPANVWVKK